MRLGKLVACSVSITAVLVGATLLDSSRRWTVERPPFPAELPWEDLTVDRRKVDVPELLGDWQWLVDESYSLLVISAFGDLFLEGPDGSVYWLESGKGRLSEVADSPEDFKALMVEPDRKDEWFKPALVRELRGSGMILGPGMCYGYKVPPSLGGSDEAGNFEPTDLQVHFSVLGQLNQQKRDSPPPTPLGGVEPVRP